MKQTISLGRLEIHQTLWALVAFLVQKGLLCTFFFYNRHLQLVVSLIIQTQFVSTQLRFALVMDYTFVPKISWKELKLEKLIGSGTFGEVYEGKWKGSTVAIKQHFLKKLSNNLMKEFQEECSLLHRCRFPHIVTFWSL